MGMHGAQMSMCFSVTGNSFSCGHPSLLQDCHLDQGGLTVLGKGIELSIIVSYPCANPFLHESHSPNMHIPIREGGISSPPCLPGTSCIILNTEWPNN